MGSPTEAASCFIWLTLGRQGDGQPTSAAGGSGLQEGAGLWTPGQVMDPGPSDHRPKVWESSLGLEMSRSSQVLPMTCCGLAISDCPSGPIFKKPCHWKSLPE